MPAEFFALSNAFFFALHNMLTKKGLKYSNPATAVLTGLAVNVTVLWSVSFLFLPVRLLTLSGALLFVLVGIFQPGLTRLLTYKSIETVGVAITDPLRATTPMFSTFLAILLLGEQMTPAIFFSTLLIIAGITLLSWRDKLETKNRRFFERCRTCHAEDNTGGCTHNLRRGSAYPLEVSVLLSKILWA